MNDETYRRWAAGRCPCCAGTITEWIDDTEPQAIAEGVMICGRCVANDHMDPPGFLKAMLESIARRTDEPIDRLLPGSYVNCEPTYGLRTRPA